MEKPKIALIWLTLFSLLTAGFGQTMIITSAPVPQGRQAQIDPFRALSSLTKLSAVISWPCQIIEVECDRQR